MASWDSSAQTIVHEPAIPYPDAPGWELIDCGCCNGIQWGDPGPSECRDCCGGGSLARHTASGLLALYPGGPIRGREAKHATT